MITHTKCVTSSRKKHSYQTACYIYLTVVFFINFGPTIRYKRCRLGIKNWPQKTTSFSKKLYVYCRFQMFLAPWKRFWTTFVFLVSAKILLETISTIPKFVSFQNFSNEECHFVVVFRLSCSAFSNVYFITLTPIIQEL